MLNFTKIARKQLGSEFEPEIASLGDSSNIALTKLQQENAFLKERNRHLEAKLARLHNSLKSGDSELAVREKICDERVSLLNSVVVKLTAEKKEICAALMKYDQHLRQAKELHLKHQQTYQELKEVAQQNSMREQAVIQLQQEKENLEQRLFRAESRILELEQHINKDDFEISFWEKGKTSYASSISGDKIKEEYPVNNTTNVVGLANKNTSAEPNRYGRPFGYNHQVDNGIYLRSTQQNLGRPDNRVSMLEQKVDLLTGEISQLKESIQKICQMLGGKEESTKYSSLQNYLDAGH